jgi:hypothetical protein
MAASQTSSWTPLRIAAGLAALLPTASALLILRAQLLIEPSRLGLILLPAVVAAAAICWCFALRADRPSSRSRLARAALGGVALGGLGFLAGFLGPLVLTPESNQGPLLGIFVTGPLGFALGVLAGWVWSFARRGLPAKQA